MNWHQLTYIWIERDDSDSVIGKSNGQEPWSLFSGRNVGKGHADDVTGHVLSLCVFIQLPWLKFRTILIYNLNWNSQGQKLNSPYLKESETYRVHLEVDKLSSGECDNNLSTIDGTSDDSLLAWGFPLVDTLVRANVANTLGVNLKKKNSSNIINKLEKVNFNFRAVDLGSVVQEQTQFRYLNKSVVSKGWTREGWRCSQESRVRDFFDGFADGEDERGIDERHDDVRVKFI